MAFPRTVPATEVLAEKPSTAPMAAGSAMGKTSASSVLVSSPGLGRFTAGGELRSQYWAL